MTPNRTDTLLWVGMEHVSDATYLVVRESLGLRAVLGEVHREGESRHARWQATRTAEPAMSTTFRTRRDAARAVARLVEGEEGLP